MEQIDKPSRDNYLKCYQYLTEISKFIQSRSESGGKFFYAEKHAQIITENVEIF